VTRSPYWEPFAHAVEEKARSAGPSGFTVDDIPLAYDTPPQVRGSVLGTMSGVVISPVGSEPSRRPQRKGAKVLRYVLLEPECDLEAIDARAEGSGL
jgi:hypothetical protein